MLNYFIKIAFRYLWRNKTFSILNFFCLTFGLTCAIIAMLYIQTMLNYDKFHKNYERIYSVSSYVTYFNGSRFPKDHLSSSLTDIIKRSAPEVENITQVFDCNHTFINGNKSFTEEGIYADKSIFETFSFPLVQGNIQTILIEPNSIVISERLAKKFFDDIDCIGKTLVLKDDDKQEAFKVTGIIKNVPFQSYLQFDFIIPFSKFITDNKWANETGASAIKIWVLLRSNVDKIVVDNKIKNLIKNQESTLNQELFLFPLKEKVLYSYADGHRVWREMKNVVIVGSIGFAILLIACFNFINLAIALNIRRHREAGIKKVVGSRKYSIVLQFLIETYMIVAISLTFAIVLVELLQPIFNSAFGSDIHFQLSNIGNISFLICCALFTGLVSGIFPALFLSSSNPIDVLKGKVIKGHSYSYFRQGLIIFQFIIPVVLIILAMIIKVQDNYMRNYDVGVDKERMIILDNTKNIQNHAESIRAELLSIPNIDAVSFTNCIPTRSASISNEVSWDGKDDSEKLHFWCINTDFDYNKVVDIQLVAGRFFNQQFPTDSVNYVINDVAANVIKDKNPVGHTLTVEGQKGTIIGVFKNFHAIDLAGPYTPTIIRIKNENRNSLLIKFSKGKFSEVASEINEVYSSFESENQFQPKLFNDLKSYTELGTPSKLIGLASFIAIMLACLGLFGLSSFNTVSRTKEIGVRKINGATTYSIMRLLLKNYTKWILIGFLFALPISLIIGNIFLSMFFFHAPIPIWTFIVGPLIAYVIALLAVSWQSYHAASQNPANSLRYE